MHSPRESVEATMAHYLYLLHSLQFKFNSEWLWYGMNHPIYPLGVALLASKARIEKAAYIPDKPNICVRLDFITFTFIYRHLHSICIW